MINTILTFLYRNIYNRKLIRLIKKLRRRGIRDLRSNSDYQIQKLVKVLELAFENIPYYKNIGDNIDLNNLSYDDFQKLPLINKDVIRKQPDLLKNSNFNFESDTAYKNSSGGSTGEPVVLYRTGRQAKHGSANYYYALLNNGVSLYKKSVDLWGAERDMYKGKSKAGLKEVLNNNVMLNTFVLSDGIIQNYIERLNKIRPHFIKAYVHSIYDIARYILQNEIEMKFKPIIHCTTGPLYPEMRTTISQAFGGAHVYNFYGSREVSAIATEVSGSEDMFILYDNVFVEILDENNKPVRKGEEGEVVISTLNNFYMPLIRYRIGDRAVKGDNTEFGTMVLENVIGRTLGVIHRKDGVKIDGQFFTTLFFGKEGIKNFQLIQKSIDYLVLKIVKTPSFKSLELGSIVDRIKSELLGVEIDIEFCEKIELTSTGKIMYVYSEL